LAGSTQPFVVARLWLTLGYSCGLSMRDGRSTFCREAVRLALLGPEDPTGTF
jgi:hypothetical protein